MDWVIDPPETPALPVRGSAAMFPVRRIYCIGRNYAEHTREMGGDPDREPPFFFQKNPGDIATDGRFPYPPKSADVHHEIEMVVALGSGGRDIPEAAALDHVWGYAVGLDMTRRDLQGEAKERRRPWEVGKAFAASAPLGALVPAAEIGHPAAGAIRLTVNGAVRQQGDLGQMIWSVPEQIAILSEYFTLAPGDLIMSGTPAGVGPVARGDRMLAEIDSLGQLEVQVV
ncbi:fumarylacetoacetate hydrolase family protein [Paralimibaculum aggregatum]|uniref:Fumarylacetoacetate hydrolase family protein n=1 Tax=Paralimibaculum aggregatum TaxID=3036245 RepID=A0ABQ6LSK5_9RHOB|nr:fumarylacetoacetate hydrolase family protein [Limibaculum sp. NKW23]GMG85057.1 fumarylacetoacetate hydrolase family protein [Limibaculum sp. NKW23]